MSLDSLRIEILEAEEGLNNLISALSLFDSDLKKIKIEISKAKRLEKLLMEAIDFNKNHGKVVELKEFSRLIKSLSDCKQMLKTLGVESDKLTNSFNKTQSEIDLAELRLLKLRKLESNYGKVIQHEFR